MRKILSLIMCFALTFCFAACKESGEKKAENDYSNREMPFEGNAAYLPYEEGRFSSQFDDEADALRKVILELKDTKPKVNKTYYVSYKGNDSNDGLTPETAWATPQWVSYMVEPYSAVLFERGGVYRGNIKLKSNVFYGAYGEGAKPCIYGSPKNYADESLWTKYNDNVWQIELENVSDVGSITFDHGKVCAMKVFNSQSLNRDYTFVSNNNKVFLYLSKGNPGEIHKDIEMTIRDVGAVFKGNGEIENVTIENICIKYGNFGISTGSVPKNLVIRGCEIGYIGGCVFESNIARWGNGIELWGAENSLVENCWIYQCYDAGFTHQSDGGTHKDIEVADNLIEFCQYNIEVWNKDGGIYNTHYHDNIFRFAGYQVFDPKVRHGSDSSCTANIQNPIGITGDINNFVIENNIFDASYGWLIMCYSPKITVRNNSWLQQPQQATYFYEKDNYKILPSVMQKDNVVYTALNQQELEKGVALIDQSPKTVIFENK